MTIEILLEDRTNVVIEYTEMGDTKFQFRKWIDGEQVRLDISLTDDELRDARKAISLMEQRKEK